MLPVVYEELIKLDQILDIPSFDTVDDMKIDKRMSDIWFSLYNQILELYNE
jgi:hypothetical protein